MTAPSKTPPIEMATFITGVLALVVLSFTVPAFIRLDAMNNDTRYDREIAWRQAYNAGAAAAEDGVPPELCPYHNTLSHNLAHEWKRGYAEWIVRNNSRPESGRGEMDNP